MTFANIPVDLSIICENRQQEKDTYLFMLLEHFFNISLMCWKVCVYAIYIRTSMHPIFSLSVLFCGIAEKIIGHNDVFENMTMINDYATLCLQILRFNVRG